MWFLSAISPTALTLFVHAVFVSGIVISVIGLLTSKIPPIAPYGFLIKIVGWIKTEEGLELKVI